MLPGLLKNGTCRGYIKGMWWCPLPKGLGTSLGPHGLVDTGQPHRDWLGIKQ